MRKRGRGVHKLPNPDVARTEANGPDDADSRVAQSVLLNLSILIVVGSVLSIAHSPAYWTASLLWGGACLATGALAGFLFGIPKTLQGGSADKQPTAKTDAKDVPRPDVDFGQRVNTNLEEISDWLTKILVGLGLAELRSVPARLRDTAAYVAGALGGPREQHFALALVVYFTVVGFMGGYLLTRLFLQRAFFMADFWQYVQNFRKTVVQRTDIKVDAAQHVQVALKDLEQTPPQTDLLQAHIETLEKDKSTLPLDRGLFITLGRLYRRLGKYDDGIQVLSEFIENKQKANQSDDTFTADAFYNRACYKALKSLKVHGGTVGSLQKQAVQDLAEALKRAPQLKKTAEEDADFAALQTLEAFKQLVQ